jgi:predicted small metal-binding protein
MYELRCKDVGFECEGVVRGASREEVLSKAGAHAREVHNVQVTPELAAKVSSLIREQTGTRGD